MYARGTFYGETRWMYWIETPFFFHKAFQIESESQKHYSLHKPCSVTFSRTKFHTTSVVGIELVSLLQNTKRKENYFFTDFFLVLQFKEDTEEKAEVSPSKQCLLGVAKTRWLLHPWAIVWESHQHGGIWYLWKSPQIFHLWTLLGLKGCNPYPSKPTPFPSHRNHCQAHELLGLLQAHRTVAWCCDTCSMNSWWI